MKGTSRDIIMIVLGIIGSIIWFIMTYDEQGMGIGNFAGPVLILGTIIIPSVRNIIKKKKGKDGET